MRKFLFWVTVCATLGLSACSHAPRPQLASRPLGTSKACAEWRWIGISRAGAQCPEVAGWNVRPLFPQLAPTTCQSEENDPPAPSPEIIRELNRFCVYEVAAPKKGFHRVPLPPSVSNDLVRLDQDCAAIALADAALDPGQWSGDTESIFLAQAAGLEEPLEINAHLGVRLAFLDTQPTGEGVPGLPNKGKSLHGYTLTRLAQQLVCASGSPDNCAAQIATRLALPIVKFDPTRSQHNVVDRNGGGFLGLQSDLAVAIRSEVDLWRQKMSSQRHLVLNLSLAWDGTLFGGLDAEQIAEMRAGTQAIYRALQYAKGFDVLVLAAAGNQKKPPCANFGPLLPAAWEMGALREDRCRQAEEGPLLYAVGGVQANGSPLANARSGGMPRRAAYGLYRHFVGSSVATAIASSIAAVVWDTLPDLTSRQVMQILDTAESGSDDMLPLKADFWFGMNSWTAKPAAPQVRRLTLCTVLEQACDQWQVAACPLRPLDPLHPLHPLHSVCRNPALAEATLSAAASPGTVPQGSCQPWLYPQPEDDPCAGCPPG